MKKYASCFLLLTVLAGIAALPLAAASPATNKATDPTEISMGSGPCPQHVVLTNEVAVIETATKGKLRLRFTNATRTTASYDWRYRAPSSNSTQEGTGSLCWAKDRVKQPNGSYQEVARPEHNSKITAGDLKIGWYASGTRAVIFISPAKATIQILKDPQAFTQPL